MRRTSIGEFVPIDTGDHRVIHTHQIDCFSQMLEFINVERRRILHRSNSTESAGPCTLLTSDHERGSASSPAIVNIGALRFLADRIQLVLKHISSNIIESDLSIPSGQICLEPRGQSFARFFPSLNR